jgi:hypothetical protein
MTCTLLLLLLTMIKSAKVLLLLSGGDLVERVGHQDVGRPHPVEARGIGREGVEEEPEQSGLAVPRQNVDSIPEEERVVGGQLVHGDDHHRLVHRHHLHHQFPEKRN